MTIFETSEGCSGLKMSTLVKIALFGLKNDLFWG